MKFENNTGLVKTENTTRLVKSENTPGLMNSENTPGLVKSENTPKFVKAETTARLMKTEQRGKNTLEMLKVEVLGENLSSSTNVCQFQRPTNTTLAAAENLRSDEEVTPFREEQGELITDL
ncbi:hypothetical protein SK128_008262 [Halocaridina rubra]|uniref:Uncharacterized protein n=1 Tax=Halocaridina rubra TaxID=373956 RepID=A0AAN8ZXT1_HALRR